MNSPTKQPAKGGKPLPPGAKSAGVPGTVASRKVQGAPRRRRS
jgi:hypothetical protein